MPTVAPLWIDPQVLTRKQVDRVYTGCEPKLPTRCLNTTFEKQAAKLTGRVVRKVNTLKGFTNWSEQVNGDWHMFTAPLKLAYAKKIDTYDRTGKLFTLPRAAPVGPVVWKGKCVERRDPIPVIRERKARYKVRVENGDVKPRSKFREPQAPAVARRAA